MFIGHLPAGYLLTKGIHKITKSKKYLYLGLIASIFPDFDLIYFYLIDNQSTLHHSYWIHIPFYWLIISSLTFLLIWLTRKKALIIPAIIFFTNIFLHLILDTIVGKIEWLFPLSTKPYYLFEVPSIYNFWVYNFFLHWTFLFEIAVIIGAIYLIIRKTLKIKQ